MAYYPYAQELGARYVLTNSGVIAVFNDPIDVNYVGMLTEVSGLDSAEVRESADDLPESDGGVHGAFYYGRRPITLNGRVFGHVTAAERRIRLDLARRASSALRSDAALSWKPARRSENLVVDPSFEANPMVWWTPTFTAGLTGTASSRVTDWSVAGATSLRMQGTQPADSTARSLNVNGPSGTSGIPVAGGVSYTASAVVNHISAPSAGSRINLLFFNAAGTQTGSLTTGTLVGAGATGVFNPTATAVAPADAAFVQITLSTRTSVSGNVVDVKWDAAMLDRTDQWTGVYGDGSMSGWYWKDNANASGSADFIEMCINVRRQQPWRVTGAWVKDFQMQMVAEDPYLYSLVQHTSPTITSASSASLENRGSISTPLIVRITGPTTTPSIVGPSGGPSLRFRSGFLLASGEAIEVDTRAHSVKYIAGGNTGLTANGSIDYAQSVWPRLAPGSTTMTVNSGGGSVVILWKDAWA